MYEVHLSKKADKFLSKLDNHLSDRIEKRLKNLKEDPFPNDTKFLGRYSGEKIFRYRIGQYRALYKVKEDVVLITKIDKMSRVYRD